MLEYFSGWDSIVSMTGARFIPSCVMFTAVRPAPVECENHLHHQASTSAYNALRDTTQSEAGIETSSGGDLQHTGLVAYMALFLLGFSGCD